MKCVVVAVAAVMFGLGAGGTAHAADDDVPPTVSGTASCIDDVVQFDSHIEGAAIDEYSSLRSAQGTFDPDGYDGRIKFYAEPIDVTWVSDDVAATTPTITVVLDQVDNPSSVPYTFANPCATATTPPDDAGPVISLNGATCPGGVATLDLHVVKRVNNDASFALSSPQGTFVYQDSGGEMSLRITNPDTDVVWESTDVSPLVPTVAVQLVPDDDSPSSNIVDVVNPCTDGSAPSTPVATITSATAACADGLVQSFAVHGAGFVPAAGTKVGFSQDIAGTEYGPDEFAVQQAAADGSLDGTTNPVLDGQLQSRTSGTVTVFLDQNVRAGGPAPRAELELTFDCTEANGLIPVTGGSTTGGGGTSSSAGGAPSGGGSAPQGSAASVVSAPQPGRVAPGALATTGSPVGTMAASGGAALLAGLVLTTAGFRRRARRGAGG